MVVTDKSEGLFYFKGNDWRKVDSEVKKGKAGKIETKILFKKETLLKGKKYFKNLKREILLPFKV